jgi:DNA-binding PucR family transcriptional regulator
MNQSEFDFNAPPKKDASEISSELLERIKKLLRLSESENPHEAALAMARAMELADRHNLDLSSLDTDDDVAHIIHRWFPLGSRISDEMRLAVGIVQRYFNVSTCFDRAIAGIKEASVIFVGSETDIVIADYVAHFLVESCRRSAKKFETTEKSERRIMSRNKRINFRAGFFYGISDQLEGRRKALFLEDRKFAIILRDQSQVREDELKNVVGETVAMPPRKYRRVYSAMEHGFHEGKNIQINAGLGTSGNTLLIGK